MRLKNGMQLYLLADRELPLIDIYALIRTGRLYDPPGKIGLAEMLAAVLRNGGFGRIDGDRLDETLDLRAARLSCAIKAEYGQISLSLHRRDLNWGLQVLNGLFRRARIPRDKIELQRTRMLERYRRRHDNPFLLGMRQFRRLLYGPKSRWANYPNPRTIRAISRRDLLAFYHRYFRPGQIRLVVAGDFAMRRMVCKLKRMFGSWGAHTVVMAKLPAGVSFVVDPRRGKAGERAAFYRTAGHEVAVLVPTVFAPSAFAEEIADWPVVALVDLAPPDPARSDRIGQLATRLGLGLVLGPEADPAAVRPFRDRGVPAGRIFQILDDEGESALAMRRILNRSALKARKEGGVILAAHSLAPSVAAIRRWMDTLPARQVTLAPLTSALLDTGDGQ